MNNRIFPNWPEIEQLKTPLTDGERKLAKFLDENLPPEWEIYVQPYLNGDRPDLVILNPSVGMVIFEVKDWNLKTYCSEKKPRDKPTHIEYFVINQGKYRISSPVEQVERYRSNLINLYQNDIGNEIILDSKKLAPFKVAIYFHNATTKEAQEFILSSKDLSELGKLNKKCVVFGHDWLQKDLLDKIVLDVKWKTSLYMNQKWAKSIRFWLKPPFHSKEQGEPIKLTKKQEDYAQPSPNKHQRLRGSAGSGKTLVIAHRAAHLASKGLKVLVVTFNITLWHYIRDQISRATFDFNWEQIEFWHFHGFCRNFFKENDIELNEQAGENEEDNQGKNKNLFDKIMPDLVVQTIKSGVNRKNRKYDAIIIDEGQDFERSYYDTLCLFLSENNELLLVIDERQNIFNRELSWVNAPMKGTRFRGRWGEINESYRLPLAILEQINKFAVQFLSNAGLIPIPPVEQLNLFKTQPHLMWKDVISFEEAKNNICQTINFLTKKQGVHPQDIVVLAPNHYEGLQLVKAMEEQGFNINHVFEDENQKYRNKKTFWMGDSRLKMSTIHSFKGWELINVIILTPSDDTKWGENLDSLLYVAMTRSRQNLVVFNRHSKYKEYGKGWSDKWFINEVNILS